MGQEPSKPQASHRPDVQEWLRQQHERAVQIAGSELARRAEDIRRCRLYADSLEEQRQYGYATDRMNDFTYMVEVDLQDAETALGDAVHRFAEAVEEHKYLFAEAQKNPPTTYRFAPGRRAEWYVDGMDDYFTMGYFYSDQAYRAANDKSFEPNEWLDHGLFEFRYAGDDGTSYPFANPFMPPGSAPSGVKPPRMPTKKNAKYADSTSQFKYADRATEPPPFDWFQYDYKIFPKYRFAQPDFSRYYDNAGTNQQKGLGAAQMYHEYDEAWRKLSPTDPNIPYPSIGMVASNLAMQGLFTAPLCATKPSVWSLEALMKANVQVFFLRAVGLAPEFTQWSETAKIEVGIKDVGWMRGEVEKLVLVLKAERVRWRSDRLGRREGGEVLKGDESTRACFHAVCELLEYAQQLLKVD